MSAIDPVSRHPVPEDEGLPDHADDDSTAFDDAARPQFRDSPPALPADRPQAVEEHGVTAAEQRQGESLAVRLAREEPDQAGGYDTLEAGTAEQGSSSAEEAAVQERAMPEVTGDEVPEQP